ncbi:MAG: VCBS domain-containing protein, partial [Nitrospira sp.]|nr:VCBS domain-containing protein [Nitrospira sp.]
SAGNLVFTPAANANGTSYARITFAVRDSNNAYDASPNTLTVNVTAVNDAPMLMVNSGSTVAEGSTDIIGSSELAVSDLDHGAAQLTYAIGTSPAHGRLELVTTPGVPATSFTQADIAANRLVYVHDGSESTGDSFTFTVSDGAGGSLGATTVTLTITPVNDAPTIVSDGGGPTAAINVSEHVSAVTIVSGHDVDLPAQALTYSISGGADQALFTIDAATGALRFVAPSNFTAALSASGDHVYVVQVQVVDSQGASATQTLQVTVTNVPDSRTVPVLPPSLVPAAPSSAPVPLPTVGPGLPIVAGPVVEPILRPAPADPMPVTEVIVPAAQGSIGREGVRTEDLRRSAEWGLRDEPQGRASDQSGRVPPVTLSVEESRLNVEEGRQSPAVLSELLFAKLDAVIEGLEEAVADETAQQAQVTRIAAASGVTLSVGFVVWALRSTALLASLFATVPAWQMLDPLPVVASHRRERTLRKHAQEQVAREEQVQYRGLHNLLDEQDAKARRSPDA